MIKYRILQNLLKKIKIIDIIFYIINWRYVMKNRSGNKLIIVFLIFILIALVAGGAYAYFMTDLFKTPEQLFKK